MGNRTCLALLHFWPQLCRLPVCTDLQNWPQLGLLYASVAKLEQLLDRPAEALEVAKSTIHILSVTHGSGGAVVKEMERVVFEAGRELGVERARRVAAQDEH